MNKNKMSTDIFAINGEIHNKSDSTGTLNEPVLVTIKRDLLFVCNKISFFISFSKKDFDPVNNMQILYNWDLWGPCLFLLILSSCLYIKAPIESKDNTFSAIYFFSFYGSISIALNALILGTKCSFFAILSLVGYCLFPFTMVSFISLFVPHLFIKSIFTLISFIHIYRIVFNSIGSVAPEEKKFVILYPISLFFIAIAFLVLVH